MEVLDVHNVGDVIAAAMAAGVERSIELGKS